MRRYILRVDGIAIKDYERKSSALKYAKKVSTNYNVVELIDLDADSEYDEGQVYYHFGDLYYVANP